MTNYKYGVDIGNSSVKASLLQKNKLLHEAIFPSTVATIIDEKYLSFHDDQDMLYFKIIKSALVHDDHILAIGQDALNLPNYKQFDVTSTSYKANHTLSTALLFGTLIKSLQTVVDELPEALDVILAASVPIVEAKTIGLIEKYQNLLEGEHQLEIYTKKGRNLITIHFTKAKVLNEGQAGFLGLMDTSDKEFHKQMTKLYKHLGEPDNPATTLEDFLIVDIGEGTTDLAVFRNKRFNPEYSYSVTKGYGNLLEEAIANANREGITAESRKDIQDVLTSDNRRRQRRRQMWESYINPTKEAYIQELFNVLLKTYGKRDYFDAIIFLGGGYTALTNFTINNDFDTFDHTLFTTLKETLAKNQKEVDLIFGVPGPYARTINERGLMQVLTALN